MNNETPSFSGRPSRTHIALALLALAGLVLFILACRPSWSADGQRVLYSYWDAGARKVAVAVFDRKTHTSRVIWVGSDAEQSEAQPVATQWTTDGEQAVITIPTDKRTDVEVLPFRSQKPARRFTFDPLGVDACLPFPQIGSHLFLGNANGIFRLDLENGEILEGKLGKEINDDFGLMPFLIGNQTMYLTEVSAAKPAEAKKEGENSQKESGELWELGEFNPRDLSFHSILTLPEAALKEKGVDELTGFFDGDPKNGRIAILGRQVETDRMILLILGRGGVEKVLDAGLKSKEERLGNPQWSRDAKLIYVAALLRNAAAQRVELAILEVPLDGKTPRIDRITEGPKSDFDDDFLSYAQIALSPDGKFIALSNGYSEYVRPEKKGIYLLDVSQLSRPVSFYPAPALPAVAKKPVGKTEVKPAAKE